MKGHLYGPHRREDAPTTMKVLDQGKWPDTRVVPIAPVLVEQRKNINAVAHRQAVARHA